ncbi:MAG: hypothetical protein KKH40_03630 [Nanoarchaeota archaeon]|nr:hypothetical protein [Nanoarchaeota archaeon]
MKFMDLCQILLDINDEKPEAEKYLKEMHDLNLIKILSEEESKKQKKYRNLLRSEDQYSLRTKESYYLQKKGKLEIKLKECDNSFEKLPNKKRFVEKKTNCKCK